MIIRRRISFDKSRIYNFKKNFIPFSNNTYLHFYVCKKKIEIIIHKKGKQSFDDIQDTEKMKTFYVEKLVDHLQFLQFYLRPFNAFLIHV